MTEDGRGSSFAPHSPFGGVSFRPRVGRLWPGLSSPIRVSGPGVPFDFFSAFYLEMFSALQRFVHQKAALFLFQSVCSSNLRPVQKPSVQQEI